MTIIDAKYGSFLGSPDPALGDPSTGDSPERLIEYAIDRVVDELLDNEQILGVLRYAADALEAAGPRG